MDKASLVRTIVLGAALLNQLLVSAGWSPLPFNDADVELGVTTAITVIVSLWTWWKNNYISKKGQKQKQVLERNGLD